MTNKELFDKVCDEIASEHYSKFYCELTDEQKVGLTQLIAYQYSIEQLKQSVNQLNKTT